MKIKFLFTISFLLYNVNILFGQLNIQFSAINEYAFNTREALNLTIINPSAKSFDVVFDGKISSGDGQIVVEFKTNPVRLNPGANILSPLNIGFRDLIYINTDIAEIELKTGTFPSGNYSICIWSACVSPDCDGAGQFAGSTEVPVCTQIHVENPTPLLLANPDNEAEIEETRPLYTWIPPAPVAGSASLNYTMKLVEVLEGQSKADALTMNRPLIDVKGIGNPMLMHPSDLQELEVGKTYAWQVEAYVGKTSVAKSEQWKFKIKKELVKKDSIKMTFILKNQLGSETYIVRSDSFKFKYLEQYSFNPNTILKYQVIDEKNNIINEFDQNSSFVLAGLNDYTMLIGFNGLNLGDGIYVIMVVNAKNEKWYLRIKIDRKS